MFKSVVDGASANSTVLGQLQCARSGAVSAQSTVDPDLFYICGGISFSEITSGCSFCEVFNVKTGKGASVDGINTSNLESCGTKNIIGLKINQGIESPQDELSIDWVVVQFVCAPSALSLGDSPRATPFSNSYLSIPDSMKEIHYAKTSAHGNVKSVSFHQVELISEQGTPRALPLAAAVFKSSITGAGSVCFIPGKAALYLDYIKTGTSDGKSVIVSVQVTGLDVTATTSSETTVKHVIADDMTCIDANGLTQSNGSRIIGFWAQDKVTAFENVNIDLEILALNSTEYSFSSEPRSYYFDRGSNMETVFSDYRWRTTKGFYQNPEPPIVWACKDEGAGVTCGDNIDCSTNTSCIVKYYDSASTSVKDTVEINIGTAEYQDFGYITPTESLHCYSGSQFKAYPINFTLVPSVFGKEDCDTARKAAGADFSMMLVQRFVLERMGLPHFTEGAPRMMIRTSEACSDNTTQCHTYQKPDLDVGNALKMCFHAVGCEKDEYVNVTGGGPDYECEAFEKCTEIVTGKYQDMGTNAGFRPRCTLVQACASPGFYRHHSPFDNVFGQVVLGQCHSKTRCGSGSFASGASTALRDSVCVEFQNCDFSTQFQNSSGDGDQDRQCIETTTCSDLGLDTVQNATRTSDTVCANVSITCPFPSQFFDSESGGCQDARVCGVKEIEASGMTATTDRVCTSLQECSFYEVEVPGSTGLQFECLPVEHASKMEEIAMMAAAGSVGIIACLFYVLFTNQDDTQTR